MPIKTKAAALKEAQRRWGESAAVKRTTCSLYDKPRPDGTRSCTGMGAHERGCPGDQPLYEVGRIMLGGLFFTVLGMGKSWDDAFARVKSNV